jgi:hypothetical protein
MEAVTTRYICTSGSSRSSVSWMLLLLLLLVLVLVMVASKAPTRAAYTDV